MMQGSGCGSVSLHLGLVVNRKEDGTHDYSRRKDGV